MKHFLGINWLVRIKNPIFWAQLLVALMLPVLAYFGRDWSEITSWPALFSLLGQAVSNPVVVVSMLVSSYNILNDPTTKGLGDSAQALSYDKPKEP